MKKIINTILIYILFVLFVPILSYGANIDLKLVSKTQEYKIAENKPLEIEIKLGDFLNIEEKIVLGYTALLEYDKSIFKDPVIEGKNSWEASYNSISDVIEGDTDNASSNTVIAKLTFKTKGETLRKKQNTKIKLKDILISDGNFQIKQEKEIEITIMNDKIQEKTQQIKDFSIISAEEIQKATTSANQIETLPNVGRRWNIIVLLVILIIATIIFRIKSRKVKY